MLSSQEEKIERMRVFAQDQSVQRQATTMHQFAVADAQTPRGRFSAIDAAYVVGSTPDVAGAYPAASAAHQVELPPEEPLGFAIDAMPEPSTAPPSVEATGEPDSLALGSPLLSQPNPTPAIAPLNCSEGSGRRGVGLGLRRRV
jgi:hypothetical protein